MNFKPLREIATAFFATAGIPLSGTVWADGMDRIRDVRQVPGFAAEVRDSVRRALQKTEMWEEE